MLRLEEGKRRSSLERRPGSTNSDDYAEEQSVIRPTVDEQSEASTPGESQAPPNHAVVHPESLDSTQNMPPSKPNPPMDLDPNLLTKWPWVPQALIQTIKDGNFDTAQLYQLQRLPFLRTFEETTMDLGSLLSALAMYTSIRTTFCPETGPDLATFVEYVIQLSRGGDDFTALATFAIHYLDSLQNKESRDNSLPPPPRPSSQSSSSPPLSPCSPRRISTRSISQDRAASPRTHATNPGPRNSLEARPTMNRPDAQGRRSIVHPDRPFKCDQCPHAFCRDFDLARHKSTHLVIPNESQSLQANLSHVDTAVENPELVLFENPVATATLPHAPATEASRASQFRLSAQFNSNTRNIVKFLQFWTPLEKQARIDQHKKQLMCAKANRQPTPPPPELDDLPLPTDAVQRLSTFISCFDYGHICNVEDRKRFFSLFWSRDEMYAPFSTELTAGLCRVLWGLKSLYLTSRV